MYSIDNNYSKRNSSRWQETEAGLVLRIPLAGYKKSEVDLTVEDWFISISAKSKTYGDVSFTCHLPAKSYDNISATLEDGILQITVAPVPKKKIPIK